VRARKLHNHPGCFAAGVTGQKRVKRSKGSSQTHALIVQHKVEFMFYNQHKYFKLFQAEDTPKMAKDHLIEFERESVQRLDQEQILERFSELHKAMNEANNLTCLDAPGVKFNLNFVFADVLECVNLLTFNNLSKVIGIANAGRIWRDVKTQRK